MYLCSLAECCVCVCVCACVCSTSTMSVLHRELFKHLSVLRLIQSKHVSTSAGNKTIHLDHPVLLFTELEVGFTVILILIFVYLLRLHYFLSLLCCYCCTSACWQSNLDLSLCLSVCLSVHPSVHIMVLCINECTYCQTSWPPGWGSFQFL